MIMMADEFQDLQGELASSRPRRADGVVPFQRLAGSGPRNDQRQEKTDTHLEQSGQRNSLLLGLLILFRPSVD